MDNFNVYRYTKKNIVLTGRSDYVMANIANSLLDNSGIETSILAYTYPIGYGEIPRTGGSVCEILY